MSLRTAWTWIRRRAAVLRSMWRAWLGPPEFHASLVTPVDGQQLWDLSLDDRYRLALADVKRIQRHRVLHRDDLNEIIHRWATGPEDLAKLSHAVWGWARRANAQRG